MRIDCSQRWVVLVVGFLLALGGDAAMAQGQKTTIDTLVRFDQLDFDAFSKQDWTLFNQIHCSDVKVVLPDGHGRWTATTIVMEGTFTKPWPMGGKVIPPTGNKLKITAVTLARWQNGCIAEEQLFWDNATYMQQLGLK